MEDFATMLQRDYGLNPQGKLTPMSVSRGGVGINNNGGMARVGLMGSGRHGAEGTSGSATFLLREEVSEESLPFGGIGSTSLSRAWQGKGADEPFGGGAAVEYDDVFGGPPRYMPSRYGPQTTLSTLDEVFKVQSRPQSFKGSSLPVFELPVFGDDIYGGSSSISRAAVVGYEDVFNGGPAANATRAANSSQYGEAAVGISRSKPSSRSSSRRLSPIHPSVLNNVHNSQDEQLPRTVSAEPARPRSLASRFLRRSSFSSFDDSAEKPVERTSAIIKNEPVASSVPSSPPPHIAHWQHLRRPLRSFSGNNIRSLGNGTKLDVDDVFGGFPQRGSIVSVQPSSDGRLESVQTHGGMSSVGSPSTVSIDKILGSRESSSTNLKAVSSIHKYGFLGNESTFLSSPSSTDEQGLQEDFIEIRMDQLKDPSVSETIKEGSGKSWLSIVDVNLATHPSSEPPPSRPPPAPATQRKIKTWHDWVAETPVCEPAVVSSPISVDSKSNSSTKGENYGDFDLSSKEMDESKNSVASGTSQHAEETLYFTDLKEKPEGSSLAASSATLKDGMGWSKLRFKSAKETVEMEEQELQARLTSVRKRKDELKRDAKLDHVVHEKREGSEEEQKVQSRDLEGATYEQSGKDVRNDTAPARKPIDNTFEMTERVAAGLRDRAEKIGTEKIGMMAPQWVSLQDTWKNRMDRVSTDSLVLPAELAATESHCTVKKGHANEGWQKADSVTYEEHVQGEVNNSKTFSSVTCSSIGDTLVRNPVAQDSKKDLAQSDHLNNSSIGEAINTKLPSSVVLGDDIDSDPIMDGFQELEGENPERRKARWERELRARDRVAKALEEKQQRDAEIKREQSEKHQIAEASDYQIKRWSAGKEGNLRALLSNLQHVLWSDNGWQPIPLTDLIEGAAVKKAYRKATLFVHPDKVQQKGATIQQKYVAEKVFDILQEAWKTFNTQELF